MNFRKKFKKKRFVKGSVQDIRNYMSDIEGAPRVGERKLSEQEMLIIDGPLDISELDNALLQLNKNSAGGMDGLTTRLCIFYWQDLRWIVFRGLCKSMELEELPKILKYSRIKLLHKKMRCTNYII